MDWKKTVCDFVIFRGAAVVQLLGTSIEKPRQARAIPKNHDRRVRFRKTTAFANPYFRNERRFDWKLGGSVA